ncbi:MAG: SPOR domain-containing protein [Chromatiales bacterium]|nr:SPOR domain-containing protein [Chromatiales bacterium]
MKGFFILLLLTNVFVLGWQVLQRHDEPVLSPYRDVKSVNQGLTLLAEYDETKPPAEREQKSTNQQAGRVAAIQTHAVESEQAIDPVIEVVADKGSSCYQSSMLVSLSEAVSLQKELELAGIRESDRRTVKTTKTNYWVKLPPYRSRAEANEASRRLEKNRIKDFFVVRSGRHENAISLGVFSTLERAEMRHRTITTLNDGINKPIIEAMELPAKRLVIVFSIRGEATPALNKIISRKSEPQLKKITCKQ